MPTPTQPSTGPIAPDAGAIRLTAGRLTVDIARPGSDAYRRSRFDWTGFIMQVTLDGRHTFCGPEAIDGTGTGGAGLCNEFGLNEPIGFDDARPGDTFPKLGVGLLTRPDHEHYRFHHDYEIAPFPIREQPAPDGTSITFTVDPIHCRGYAGRLRKRISVTGNELLIEYDLENVGVRPLRTREYTHNFLTFNGQPVGPDYVLTVPCALRFESTVVNADTPGRITWRTAPRGQFHARTDLLAPDASHWTLSHAASGLSVTEQTSAVWSRFALYGTPLIISPEAFLNINVEPGQSFRWHRRYTFAKA